MITTLRGENGIYFVKKYNPKTEIEYRKDGLNIDEAIKLIRGK